MWFVDWCVCFGLLLPDDALPVLIPFVSQSSCSSSRSFPFIHWLFYATNVSCPGPLCLLTCSVTALSKVIRVNKHGVPGTCLVHSLIISWSLKLQTSFQNTQSACFLYIFILVLWKVVTRKNTCDFNIILWKKERRKKEKLNIPTGGRNYLFQHNISKGRTEGRMNKTITFNKREKLLISRW